MPLLFSPISEDIEKAVREITELASFYESLGDLALSAEDVDLELAFERYRQAVLIENKQGVRNKIKSLLTALADEDKPAHLLRASRSRLRKSIQEFDKLLPKLIHR